MWRPLCDDLGVVPGWGGESPLYDELAAVVAGLTARLAELSVACSAGVPRTRKRPGSPTRSTVPRTVSDRWPVIRRVRASTTRPSPLRRRTVAGAGREEENNSCSTPTHSFVGGTAVLMVIHIMFE